MCNVWHLPGLGLAGGGVAWYDRCFDTFARLAVDRPISLTSAVVEMDDQVSPRYCCRCFEQRGLNVMNESLLQANV